jgi:hypothetical protein
VTVDEFVDAVIPTVGEPCRERSGCDDYADHTCTDETARCRAHCVCVDPDAASYDVTLTITLDDVTDPAEAARRFLRAVRNAPAENTELHLDVTPVEGGHTTTVRVTPAQQRADTEADARHTYPDGTTP